MMHLSQPAMGEELLFIFAGMIMVGLVILGLVLVMLGRRVMDKLFPANACKVCGKPLKKGYACYCSNQCYYND